MIEPFVLEPLRACRVHGWRCESVLEGIELCGMCGMCAEAGCSCDSHADMASMAQWRCGFALESGQPCGERATYGGFCDAHMRTVTTCLCGAPALGEAALADDMYMAHPTLCEDCAAEDDIWACGNCGRLGTEDVVDRHSESAHYTTRPRGTTASAETVAKCLASLPSERPTCTVCDRSLFDHDDLREHAVLVHLEGVRQVERYASTHLVHCRLHIYTSDDTYRGGFCRLCIRRHPKTLQWVCEPCGRVEIGQEGPAQHFSEGHRDLQHRLVPSVVEEHTCRICGDKWLPEASRAGRLQWPDEHFVSAHVANLVCPLEGCRGMPPSPWAKGALRQHTIDDHQQAFQLIAGYRDPVLLCVRYAFASARLQLDTTTTSSVRRRMLCSAAWLAEDSRRFGSSRRAFLLADYMLALGSPGPLLRELCWDSTRPPTDIDGLEAAVIARFHAVTDPRCIPVGSRKSYANLPADMWRVIMAQLSHKDAVALGQTCRRLWAIYEDVWQGPTDALLAWLRILPTDIRREGQCDTCGMPDAEAYFVLTAKEIKRALGHNEDGYYSVRGLAHTALLKYGSVEAFKKAYVEQLAKDFFDFGTASISDYDDWEEDGDGETASVLDGGDHGEGDWWPESE